MSAPTRLKLPADCSIRTIRSLHGEVGEAFAQTGDLTLDCTDVTRVDIAFVQLVVSAAKTATRQAKHLRLANMPAAVEVAFQRAGVAPDGLDRPVS
ncbi:hypothetical protein PMNALOAF_1514 [Methylobacterium adhaesivum]|jgi:anti-anti-sigma regulatory factor|uniref:STAS domain-containing protein n=1 Tax=Methylobacterium adhaesivum TaxID=333297 RepID=A0ABT8BDA8_9HYPH|nr:STAS domain-containing protein [Methylobacterium adhaesivum]MDN3589251.1 STAS domain-containing protein [Methylobacterium adhaesivum]GJD30270.1 hypothetical protein PMNALOAF_1514 [Methylobacterium adhaesivum]